MSDPATDALEASQAAITRRLRMERLAKLEQVSIQLRGLYTDATQCLIAEKEAKASLWHERSGSNAERESYASAQAVTLVTETIKVNGEIRRLEEERNWLMFVIEHDR